MNFTILEILRISRRQRQIVLISRGGNQEIGLGSDHALFPKISAQLTAWCHKDISYGDLEHGIGAILAGWRLNLDWCHKDISYGDLEHGIGAILAGWRLNLDRFRLMNFTQLIQKLGYSRSGLASAKIHELIKKIDIDNDADRLILVINELRLLQTRAYNLRKAVFHIRYGPGSHEHTSHLLVILNSAYMIKPLATQI